MANIYNPIDYKKLFGDVAAARKNALDAALTAQIAAYGRQKDALPGQYNTLRGQAYSNVRLTALGDNEALAAQGLAGAANAGPTSGYSETSRTAQNVALQNAVNALNTQQQGAANDIYSQQQAAGLSRDQQWASTQADLAAQRVAAEGQQNQFRATLEQQERAAARAREEADRAAAYQEVATFGRVITQRTANILGVKIGTKIKR